VLQRSQGLFPSKSHLETLFTSVGAAVEQGRLREALRIADRACRIAPGNLSCRLVHARVLLQVGAASEVIDLLRGSEEPDAIVARAEAFHMRGALDDAIGCVESLLRRFAVDSVENLRQLAGRLCRPPAMRTGWIGVDSRLRLTGQTQSGSPAAIAYEGKIRHPVILGIEPNGLASFEFELPARVNGRIAAFSGHIPLLGSGFGWPPDFGLSGWVILDNRALVGKVRLDWARILPVTLAITPSSGAPSQNFVLPSTAGGGISLFSIPLNGLALDASYLEVGAALPDGTCSPLCGSPIKVTPVEPTPIGPRPQRPAYVPHAQEPNPHRTIDIVVPVYSGFQETLFCLDHVLETTTPGEAEVVVVNDASQDPELCAAVFGLAQGRRITLLTNSSNLGFPGSANRGIELHPERDVVLLNADAEVPGGWLKRLQSAAYQSADIGTVTPLGESASIMSYPSEGNGVNARLDCDLVDLIAREVNADGSIDLPVGVGFCMYIKRACLDEVGPFDASSFGKGYGEEDDFCLRARRKGWRHLGALNLFVGHRGGTSYGRSQSMLRERNRRVLNILHPGYDDLVASFVATDPLLHARRAIDTCRLLDLAKNPVLLVTFDLAGGVKRHVDQRQSELSAAGQTVLVLQPAGASGPTGKVTITTGDATLKSLVYTLPEESAVLGQLLARLDVSHVEIHHFAGLPPGTLELATSLGIPYDVYVHDYAWVCPRISLVNGNHVYCGEPAVDECEVCIRTHGAELKELTTVAALRSRSGRILEGARDVVVPARDVRTRLERYFPGVPMNVVAWELPLPPRPRSVVQPSARIRVATIGAISIQKGYEVLLECARDAARRDLNLDFVVIGYTEDDEMLRSSGRVFVTGPYAEGEIHQLLEREQCQIAFFPSVAPETWCYALTHAMAAGLAIAAFDLGAIAERLVAYQAAQLLPIGTSAAQINNLLMEFVEQIGFSSPQKPKTQKELSMSETSSQELEASVKMLTLPVGVYVFTVQGSPAATPSGPLALPALQLGLAPMQSHGEVEFLAGAGTLDRWLTRSTDAFIVRISGASVALLLTSVRLPSSPALTIDVQRIDTDPRTAPAGFLGSETLQILAHIENFGDIYFTDGRAGFGGQKLRLEAFAILSAGALEPNAVEYCGVMGDGYQTPWLSNQVPCGSRGRGMPLVGFAIRLKPEIATSYDCSYTGKFVSGSEVGPLTNGELCISTIPGDALEAIEIAIAGHSQPESKIPGHQIEYSDVS
jgi:GT2 family glycosyltransferase